MMHLVMRVLALAQRTLSRSGHGEIAANTKQTAGIFLRQLARYFEATLPNVYDKPATAPASATLCYSVGGKAMTPETWADTGKADPDPHPVLSAISVFDAHCAAVHLKGENEVWFRPFGLDIPDELGNVCKQVKALVTLLLGRVIRKLGDGSDGGYGVALNAAYGTEEHPSVVPGHDRPVGEQGRGSLGYRGREPCGATMSHLWGRLQAAA
jgi:hypothetical protein